MAVVVRCVPEQRGLAVWDGVLGFAGLVAVLASDHVASGAGAWAVGAVLFAGLEWWTQRRRVGALADLQAAGWGLSLESRAEVLRRWGGRLVLSVFVAGFVAALRAPELFGFVAGIAATKAAWLPMLSRHERGTGVVLVRPRRSLWRDADLPKDGWRALRPTPG